MNSLKLSFKSFVKRLKVLIAEFKELHILVFGLLLSLSLSASGDSTPTSIFDLMNHREVLNLTLESDFEKLKSDRSFEEYVPAFLSFKDASGLEQAWKMKVKLRGKFRRMNCADIPPLKLKFKKSELAMAGLADYNDMKLVPQCVEDKELAADYLKREYLTYRLFNEISPYSYRVQLLRITYIDSGTGKRSKQWAFLIEDTAQLKERLNAKKVDKPFNLPEERFHLHATRLVSVFQYLIGNTDWSLSRAKNVKLLEVNGKVVPIPYDFDFSGLVNTNYAAPDPSLGLTYRRERVYLGFRETTEDLRAAIRVMLANQDDFEELIEDFRPLTFDSRADVEGYLNSFLGNPEITKFAPEMVVSSTPQAVEADK